MAVRIPVYERHVQLDSGAQTIPRVGEPAPVGKAISSVGNAMIAVAAHYKAKQDALEHMQMGQNVSMLKQQLAQIAYEEQQKFDPSRDSVGTLHDRINARSQQAIAAFTANAPSGLRKEYDIHGQTEAYNASISASHQESQTRNSFGQKYLDGFAATLKAQVTANPDSAHQAVALMRNEIKKTAAQGNVSPEQQQRLFDGYAAGLSNSAITAFQAQGRGEAAEKFAQEFRDARKLEDAASGRAPLSVAPAAPGAPGASAAPGPQSLNQKRIDQINAKPEVKAAIEKAAAANGLDPDALKVFASVESDGNPKSVSPNGKNKGLFQLDTAEFGMNNGGKGDILDINDNAQAAAKVLAQKQQQLTTQLGRPPTFNELYLSHQQGMSGVTAHMQNPDQPAWQSVRQFYNSDAAAKSAISGNVPKDIVARNYGGDPDKITSKEFMAIQGTRVQGGGVDQAIAAARQPSTQGLVGGTVTASADGTVMTDTRPAAYVGGVNIGGQQQDARVYPGAKVVFAPGQTFGNQATANAKPFTAIVSHYTGSDSLQSALETAKGDPSRGGNKFGYHFYIDKDGTVIQGAPLDQRTNHVQRFPIGGRTSRPDINNENAIGVAFVGTDKPNEAQLNSEHQLMAGLQQKYNIPKENVVGHGEIQPGSRSPDEGMDVVNRIRSDAPVPPGGPVQVAGPGVPQTGAPTVSTNKWDQLYDSQKNRIDGGTLKAAAIQQSMKKSLLQTSDSDIKATQLTGSGVKLSPELQKYYGTDTLTYDLIANKIGTGEAIRYQQNKDYAEKIYGGGAHMEEMPREAILDRLNTLAPDPNSPNLDRDTKVYNEVLKKAQGIEKARNLDPAGFALQSPAVQEARKAAVAATDPTDKAEKYAAYIKALMGQQQLMGIDPALQTPLTNQDAKILSQPLLDRARANKDTAPREVVDNIVRTLGKATADGFSSPGEGTPNAPDLAHRALQTILKNQKITNDQASQTADALVTAQHPPPPVFVPNQIKKEPNNYYKYIAKDDYFVDPSGDFSAVYQPPPPPGQVESYTHDTGKVDSFKPGQRFVRPDDVAALLKDPSLEDFFDYGGGGVGGGYGAGAARHFLSGGKNTPESDPLGSSSNPLMPPEKQLPNIMVPRPADVLTPPEKQEPDQSDQGDSSGAPF